MSAKPEELLDMGHYLQKSYCKTASLMANSCRAIAVLGGHTEEVRLRSRALHLGRLSTACGSVCHEGCPMC